MDNSIFFGQLLDHSLCHIVVIDKDGCILFVNKAWSQFGKDNGSKTLDWKGVNYLNVCEMAANNGDKSADLAIKSIRDVINGASRTQCIHEYPCHSPQKRRWFSMRIFPINVDGVAYFAIYHDPYSFENELRQSKERLALAAEGAEIGIWEYDVINDSLIWDSWMHKIYGSNADRFRGTIEEWRAAVHPDDIISVNKKITKAWNKDASFEIQFRIITAKNKIRHILAKGKTYAHLGKIFRVIGVNIDITEKVESNEIIRKLAYYDQLTNLPNRTLFSNHCRQNLKFSIRQRMANAILFIDLDQFKRVNDTAGHSVGDSLLQAVAKRFSSLLRAEDTLCRFSGDEFVILASGFNCDVREVINGAKVLADKLLKSLNDPFIIEGYSAEISASIGVSLFFGNAVNIGPPLKNMILDSIYGTLLMQADIAMYKAKEAGRNRYCFFDQSLLRDMNRKTALEFELKRGIADNSFTNQHLFERKG